MKTDGISVCFLVNPLGLEPPRSGGFKNHPLCGWIKRLSALKVGKGNVPKLVMFSCSSQHYQ